MVKAGNMKETAPKRKTDELFLIPGIQPRLYSATESRQVFDQIDLDKNGCLDESDIRNILLVTGQTATDEEIREMIRMVDHDGSGLVTFEEFNILCSQPEAVFQNPDIEKAASTGNPSPSPSPILNTSQVIPAEYRELLLAKFATIDFDDLGYLTLPGFLQLLSRPESRHLKRMFDLLTQSTGKLSTEALLSGLIYLQSDQERRKFLFDLFDFNESGMLERDELMSVVQLSKNVHSHDSEAFIYDVLNLPRGAPVSSGKFQTLFDVCPEFVFAPLQELEEIYNNLTRN